MNYYWHGLKTNPWEICFSILVEYNFNGSSCETTLKNLQYGSFSGLIVKDIQLGRRLLNLLSTCDLEVKTKNLRFLMMKTSTDSNHIENILRETTDVHLGPLKLELGE